MSKLRADEFVNSDDNGAPSFPHSATVPAPTADNHFATKLYADTSASTKSSSITNTISNTAPSNPSAGDFWTNTTSNIISLNIWNGSSWVNVKNSVEISAGQIVTPPSISDPNGGYIPTMLTATSAVVSDATLSSSKWYKDDVEIPGATGLQYYATDTGTYKYEEIWVDTFGTQLFPSLSAVIDARAGVIDAQPTITSSNGVYSPTTLTATAAVVSNATLVGSKWYKDGVEVPGETGLSINILAHEQGIYKYEETWTDHFGTQLLPTLSASVQVFATIADPTVLTPTDEEGILPISYTPETSNIVNVVDTSIVGGTWTSYDTGITGVNGSNWRGFGMATNGSVMVAVGGVHDGTNQGANSNGNRKALYSTDGVNWNFANIPGMNNTEIVPGACMWSSAHNKFILVSQGEYGRSNLIHYSSNGQSWSQASHPSNVRLNQIAFDGNYYVATSFVGNHCVRSSNGTSWSNGGSMGSGHWAGGLAGGNGVFIAVAAEHGNVQKRSTDGGSSWSTINLPSGPMYSDIATDGNGTWVACGDYRTTTPSGNRHAISTDDGVTWSEISGATSSADFVEYGGGTWMFYYYGYTKICPSPADGGDITDPSTWENGVTTTPAGYANCLSYGAFNNSSTGEAWMIGRDPGFMWIDNPRQGSTSYELELSNNSIFDSGNRVSDVTISDLFTTDTLVSSSTGASGRLKFDANDNTKKITLKSPSGTWNSGDKVISSSSATRPHPGLTITPSLTSSEPAVTQGSVTTWGNAQWQIAEDSGFTTNVQSLTSVLTSSGTQTGPTGFTLDYNKNYYVRTKYNSSNPAGIFSNWSVANLFKTKKESIYADDLFSTYLYEGNADASGSQTINNGIDLSGEGGFVWIKRRTAGSHTLYDTERGATQAIYTTTDVESARPGGLTSFNNNGFTVGNYTDENAEGQDLVSWTFRKAPGFFDVVTYTGNGGSTGGAGDDGSNSRDVPHNLGTTPGMIMVKCLDNNGSWFVWHRDYQNTTTDWMSLNTNGGVNSHSNMWGDINASSFGVTNRQDLNNDGLNYVAYIFAHDDARFGTNDDESIIKCGSWTASGGAATVDLGFEPQLVLMKNATDAGYWLMFDSMRGMTVGGNDAYIAPNTNHPEDSGSNFIDPTPTGFKISNMGSTQTFVYMAIRRPHKPVTSATEVFNPVTYTGTGSSFTYNNGFPLDLVWHTHRGGSNTSTWIYDRLRGTHKRLITSTANNEENANFIDFDKQNSVGVNGNSSGFNSTNENYIQHVFRRAPGFMDVVTADYPDISGAIPHNLGVAPELIINKPRNGNIVWMVGSDYLQNTNGWNRYIELNSDASEGATSVGWDQTAPTDTHFTLGSYPGQSYNGVFYLFASLDGISKVGSYTGTGGNVDVDCGFAAGARFVMIKRTDSTGDWYIWDSARGIVSGNDPYLLLNETAAEVTNTDYIDPLNAGFTVTSSAPAALNASGGTYLFLAIA